VAKPFVGSYSKLKSFESCAFKYLKVDVQKLYKETSEQLTWGNTVHSALEHALKDGTPLPASMKPWQKWVDMITRLPGALYIEEKWALTRDMQPTDYFGPSVWWRARGDVLVVDHDSNRAALIDWKTGAEKHDSVQLLLNAACAFAYHPEIERIKATFIWLADDTTSSDDFTKEDVASALRNGILDRIGSLEGAHQTQHFPKRPSGLCIKWCPCIECEFHGKGTPR
jgi:hypothetical protein